MVSREFSYTYSDSVTSNGRFSAFTAASTAISVSCGRISSGTHPGAEISMPVSAPKKVSPAIYRPTIKSRWNPSRVSLSPAVQAFWIAVPQGTSRSTQLMPWTASTVFRYISS